MDKEQKAILINKANDNPLLNYEGLQEACSRIFEGKTNLSYNKYIELTKSAYQIDMLEYAKEHNFFDAVTLVNYFASIRLRMKEFIPVNRFSNRVLVIGAGQGRLAEIYIHLANRLGIKELVFNDLSEKHIQQAESNIKNKFGSSKQYEDLKIDYLVGDFTTIELKQKFDMIYSLWFVGSEIFTPESTLALKSYRKEVYKKLNNLLVKGGAFVEEIPDITTGLYDIANAKTEIILKDRGILEGQNHNFMLTNWKHEQQNGFPYQLRFTPRNGSDYREKEVAGFIPRKSQSDAMPVSSIVGLDSVVDAFSRDTNLWNIIKKLQNTMAQVAEFPRGDKVDLKSRKITWWEKERSV